MKCHYTYYLDKGKKKRCLIPGCMSVAVSGDIKDCTCSDISFTKFEKEKYNKIVAQLKSEIDELAKENKHLIEIIDKFE